MLFPRRILLAAAVGLVAAAAPATASAADITVHTYDVLVEGEASYVMHSETPGGATGTSTQDHAAEFSWATEMSQVEFYDDKITAGASGKVTSLHVTKASRRGHLANNPPQTYECTGTSANAEASHGSIRPMGASPDGGSRLGIKVITAVRLGTPSCTGINLVDSSLRLSQRPDVATHPFETWFDLPPDAIGQGKIIQLLERKITGAAECPNGEGPADRQCSLIWKATATLTKTGTEVLRRTQPAPAPAPQPAPTPVPPKPATPVDLPGTIDEDLIPLPKLGKVTPAAATASGDLPEGLHRRCRRHAAGEGCPCRGPATASGPHDVHRPPRARARSSSCASTLAPAARCAGPGACRSACDRPRPAEARPVRKTVTLRLKRR
jgi:hypothetical protein